MTLTTVIASGNRAPSRRRRLGSVAIEASPAQFQPLIQQIVRAIHEAGGRKAASASGVPCSAPTILTQARSEEHTSELQSQSNLVCRLLLEKKKYTPQRRARPRGAIA